MFVFPAEMVLFMKEVAGMDVELTVEERNLLSVAYKNVIGARRASWRIISSIEQREESKGGEEKLKMIRGYRQQVNRTVTVGNARIHWPRSCVRQVVCANGGQLTHTHYKQPLDILRLSHSWQMVRPAFMKGNKSWLLIWERPQSVRDGRGSGTVVDDLTGFTNG